MVWGPDWEFSQDTGVNTPTLTMSTMVSLMTSESQDTRLTSRQKDGTRHRVFVYNEVLNMFYSGKCENKSLQMKGKPPISLPWFNPFISIWHAVHSVEMNLGLSWAPLHFRFPFDFLIFSICSPCVLDLNKTKGLYSKALDWTFCCVVETHEWITLTLTLTPRVDNAWHSMPRFTHSVIDSGPVKPSSRQTDHSSQHPVTNRNGRVNVIHIVV